MCTSDSNCVSVSKNLRLRHHAIPHDNSWTEVKVFLHNVQQLPLALLGGPIVEDGDREGMGNSNSIGYLKQLSVIMYTLRTSAKTGETFWKIRQQSACTMFFSTENVFQFFILHPDLGKKQALTWTVWKKECEKVMCKFYHSYTFTTVVSRVRWIISLVNGLLQTENIHQRI